MEAETNLILVRGVSGAGKSTIGELFDDGATTKVLSTDDMLVSQGFYRFDASMLGEYNAATIKKVKEIMIDYDWKIKDDDYGWFPTNRIVVCNTFTEVWEMQPYLDLAEEYKWCVHTIIVENRHDSDNIHNVPTDTIKAQKERFEVYL